MQTAAPLLAESHCILGPAQQIDEMCNRHQHLEMKFLLHLVDKLPYPP